MVTDRSRDPAEYRINGGLLIRILVVIAQGCQHRRELQTATNLSQGSVTRLLAAARAQFGVEIRWDPDQGYVVDDWGVFRPEVFEAFKTNRDRT